MPHATSMCETIQDFVTLHKEQLVLSGIPERYWNMLFNKLKKEVFDAGDAFIIQQVEEEDEGDYEDDEIEDEEERQEEEMLTTGSTSETNSWEQRAISWQVIVKKPEGIKLTDSEHVYLIDHAWTYRPSGARQQLETVPGLLPRMAALMDIEMDGRSEEECTEEVLKEMWKYNQTYSIGNAELGSAASEPIWYVMDEFGSRIQHSDTPTFKTVPFCYVPTQMSFNILWPIVDLQEGDEVTRNFVEKRNHESLSRKMRLLPWKPEDMTHLSYDQWEKDETFYAKHNVNESLPNLDMSFPGLPRDRNVTVYTDVHFVTSYLTDPRFELVETADEADIWWSCKYLKDFKSFSEETPGKLINQFPCENIVTVKDLLAVVSRRSGSGRPDPDTLETSPKWLQTTYNLETELPQFVSYFQHREQRGFDNHWICKPWNLARNLDTHITANLNQIMRLPDTGPKIACKYVEDPFLIELDDGRLVKHDLRFEVMLHDVAPLKLSVYNKFAVRCATKTFGMDRLDDAEQHFTVMIYNPNAEIKRIACDDFVTMFEMQHPCITWTSVETEIHNIIREVFEMAVSEPAPKGICPSPQSRALYGLDFMLKWTKDEQGERCLQPVLFEVNRGPDLTYFLYENPTFINDVFSSLFLEDNEHQNIVSL